MKHSHDTDERKRRIAHALSSIPRKMLQLHGRDNVAEFILHELGKQDTFNLSRAAYIIDNPDFDCLKGVAGFSRKEAYQGKKDIWEDPDTFTSYMASNPYNQQVRGYHTHSCRKKGCKDEQIIEEVAHHLGFTHPKWYAWDMKYDNHGLLLYEKEEEDACDCDYLLEGLCLIGFCPIY